MNPRPFPARIEPLEARIAPAIALQHPLPDLVAGPGKTGAVVDLSEMFDPAATSPNRTIVEFITNFDSDASTPGIQAGIIRLELFDELVPLTVQNFLSYVNSRNARGDYDGTFFHRAAPGFVLQGGGFNSEGSRDHIVTGPDLHNEFDPSRSNLRGTITMAKTDLSPNTATSEFFFNLADNSSNLDNQNGGFTVFGNVIQGLDIVDAIVALPTQVVISGFGAPVQNFSGSGTPTADQLIRITEAKVIPTTPGNTTGITFSVEHIYQAGTTTPSDLVAGKITGSSLNLKYKAGGAGEVDVVVTAVEAGGATVSDTFRVTVLPNLITSFVTDTLATFPAPGETGVAKITLTNSAGGIAKGKVDIRFYLAEDNLNTGLLVPSGAKIPVGQLLNQSISIAGGASKAFASRVQVPMELVADTSTAYRLIAEVTPMGTLATQELFTDDNVALDGQRNQLLNQFGDFGGRTKVPLSFVESDGDRVTLFLTGGGIGRLSTDADGKIDLSVSGGTALSKLSARVAKAAGGDGRINLNDINFTSVMRSAALGLAEVDGFVAASGGVRLLQLGDLTGPGRLSIGAFLPANTTAATIRLGSVSDFNFESLMPIASLTATEWLDTGGLDETLTFLSLGKLQITGAKNTVRGDLQASVNVTGTAAVGSIVVAGFLENARVTIPDGGTILLGGIRSSTVFAGVTELPSVLGDFSDRGTISKFVISGIRGFTGDLFVDSHVSAQNLGAVVVRKVAPDNSGSAFGFIADVIQSYNRVGGARLARLDAPAALDAAGDYGLTIL